MAVIHGTGVRTTGGGRSGGSPLARLRLEVLVGGRPHRRRAVPRRATVRQADVAITTSRTQNSAPAHDLGINTGRGRRRDRRWRAHRCAGLGHKHAVYDGGGLTSEPKSTNTRHRSTLCAIITRGRPMRRSWLISTPTAAGPCIWSCSSLVIAGSSMHPAALAGLRSILTTLGQTNATLPSSPHARPRPQAAPPSVSQTQYPSYTCACAHPVHGFVRSP